MKSAILDTTLTIETPEGVELTLYPAGPVVRALAWLIDMIIHAVIYFFLTYILGNFGDLGIGILMISIFIIEWFYPVLFEVYHRGATPGKFLMKINVVGDNGIPVTWSTSMIRNILRFVDFLPLFYGFGLLSMLVSNQFKRIGDLAAGTIVVYTTKKQKEPPILLEKQALPLPCSLTLIEQQAITHFAERTSHLLPERVEELANMVSTVTQVKGKEGVRRLQQIANGIIGLKY